MDFMAKEAHKMVLSAFIVLNILIGVSPVSFVTFQLPWNMLASLNSMDPNHLELSI